MCQLVSCPSFPWSGLIPSLLHRAPKTPSLWDSAREEEEEDEEKNEEENEDKGEEEAFNHLLSYWFHRDWEWKVLLASFFPVAMIAPELFVLQQVPASALSVLCLPEFI